MRISFCIGGRTSESTASRTQYRSWFRGFAERLRATITVIHSKKLRRGFDFVPTFAPISSFLTNTATTRGKTAVKLKADEYDMSFCKGPYAYINL